MPAIVMGNGADCPRPFVTVIVAAPGATVVGTRMLICRNDAKMMPAGHTLPFASFKVTEVPPRGCVDGGLDNANPEMKFVPHIARSELGASGALAYEARFVTAERAGKPRLTWNVRFTESAGWKVAEPLWDASRVTAPKPFKVSVLPLRTAGPPNTVSPTGRPELAVTATLKGRSLPR